MNGSTHSSAAIYFINLWVNLQSLPLATTAHESEPINTHIFFTGRREAATFKFLTSAENADEKFCNLQACS